MKDKLAQRSPVALIVAGMAMLAVAAIGLFGASRDGQPALAAPAPSTFRTSDTQPAPALRPTSTSVTATGNGGTAPAAGGSSSTSTRQQQHARDSASPSARPSHATPARSQSSPLPRTTTAGSATTPTSTAGSHRRGHKPAAAAKKPAPHSTSRAAALAPNTVWIPSIGTRVGILAEGQSNGVAGVPSRPDKVGWMDWTPSLSAPAGTVVIAGHITFHKVPGAFYRLSSIRPGAVVYTTTGAGHEQAWRVQSSHAYPKGKLPAQVWSSTGPRRLALITCTGSEGLVPKQGGYAHLDNLVVMAAPVASR